MKDSLLTDLKKREIVKAINEKNYFLIIEVLEKIKTLHAGTAKMKDKRFVVSEIVRHILENSKDVSKDFFNVGNLFCKRKEDVAKEIGVSLIWRGYKFNSGKVKEFLLKIADDKNWEVREYAGTAFANTLFHNPDFYKTVLKWIKHKSENVRRAVIFSALGLKDKKNLKKAFAIFEPLLSDDSKYVKKNLGPFIIGSHFLYEFPDETIAQLKKWSKNIDENVRWNIIMAFNNSFGKRNHESALEILKYFTGDPELAVRRALLSTLRFLNKHHNKSVTAFIKEHNLNFNL